ncbi:unnamed protein product [Schistocephalus solidus]|uniref:EF-hand domain-containing protein n=1 Tax=Schistocephalus solidus TaxID=70667 RepID=A0A183SFK5_SCHSO|nr:unnamed protein product [Schistocephalus solidus]
MMMDSRTNLPEAERWRARVTAVPFGAVVGLGKAACLLASPTSISGLSSRCCSPWALGSVCSFALLALAELIRAVYEAPGRRDQHNAIRVSYDVLALFYSLAIDELMESLDADKSGKVSAEELMTALKGSGIDLESVKTFITSIDKDGDGQLDKKELRAFFKELGY